MIKLPQRDAKTLVAVHGWCGIALGLLLYVVICTGVVAVFASDLANWSSPLANRARLAQFPDGTDAAVRRLASSIDSKLLAEVAIAPSAGGRIDVFFRHDAPDPSGKTREQGIEFELDPVTWRVLATRSGYADDIEAARRSSSVADFFVNLHVRLRIPEPWGFLVTGILGVAMMIAAVTAVLIHRHLLADLFTLRLGRDALLRRRDLHVVAGSWNLPFAFLLALTGSFFSLAASVGLPAIAMVQFNGDQEALNDTLYGTARAQDATPMTTTNIETLLANTRARMHAEPDFISIEHYGRADSTVAVSTELPSNTLVYSSDLYDGVTGALIRIQPPLGKIPSTGASLVGLMYPLHFGNFAGVASKAVWVALGSAAAYVALTGMLLWTRRRDSTAAWRRIARLVHGVGYGLPFALACTPYAFFLLPNTEVHIGDAQDKTLIAAAILIACISIAVRDLDRLRRFLLAATGATLIGLPIVRIASGGMRWPEAWTLRWTAVPVVDVTLAVIGALAVYAALRRLAVAEYARLPMGEPSIVEG